MQEQRASVQRGLNTHTPPTNQPKKMLLQNEQQQQQQQKKTKKKTAKRLINQGHASLFFKSQEARQPTTALWSNTPTAYEYSQINRGLNNDTATRTSAVIFFLCPVATVDPMCVACRCAKHAIETVKTQAEICPLIITNEPNHVLLFPPAAERHKNTAGRLRFSALTRRHG